MEIKNELIGLQKEINEIKEQSLAMEMIRDSKKANMKICILFSRVIFAIFLLYFATVALFLRYIDNINSVDIVANTKTQEITDIDTIENSSIVNGDMYGENKAN